MTDNITKIKIPFSDIYTTAFIVNTDSGALLFDTGTYPDDVDRFILPTLTELGLKERLKYVFISHRHADHAGGLERVLEIFDGVTVLSRSEELKARFSGACFICPDDSQQIANGIFAIAIPGHSPDAMALFDSRCKTLLTGDCLQLYGVFGSGDWGCNITDTKEHFKALEKLKAMQIDTIIASHDYYPLGYKAEGEDVKKYIDACKEPVERMLRFMENNRHLGAKEAAALYNSTKKLPRVSYKVFEKL